MKVREPVKKKMWKIPHLWGGVQTQCGIFHIFFLTGSLIEPDNK